MPRVNVWIPDDLHNTIRTRLPKVNLSAVTQGALAALLECRHDQLACVCCSTSIDRHELADRATSALYSDALWELDPLVRRGGTAEGAARVLKDVAARHRVTAALRIPLPRPTRTNRADVAAAKVTPMPTEAESRGRHPTRRSA